MIVAELDQGRPKIYVESSVIGYLTSRRSRDTITAARQEITQAWWSSLLTEFVPFVSTVVLDEVSSGDFGAADDRKKAVSGLAVLDVNEEGQILAGALVGEGAVPEAYPEDALHIALATVHGMDFLVTWNSTHINNAVLRGKVENVCENNGYACPVICSPEELPGGIT